MKMFDFAEITNGMSEIKILNYYRNLYYKEPQVTERGIVANAIDDMFDFIDRQKAEIERLKECPKCVYEYDGEVTEYCVQSPCSNFKTVEQIKAEAYKKFAREVTEEIKKAYDNNSSVLREHFEKHREKPNFEFVATIQGKMNTLRGLDDFIDNLKKEMVGEEE